MGGGLCPLLQEGGCSHPDLSAHHHPTLWVLLELPFPTLCPELQRYHPPVALGSFCFALGSFVLLWAAALLCFPFTFCP